MSGDRVGRRMPLLEFADPGQEARYRWARDVWIRARILPVAMFIAVVFVAFILFDAVVAPDRVLELAAIRAGTAIFLVGVAVTAVYQPGVLSISGATCLLVAGTYAGVLMTRVIVGEIPVYEFNEAIMLIQVGTWFFGGVTFPVAARLNAGAILVYLAIDLFLMGEPPNQVGQAALYLGSLFAVCSVASYNIERQFRENFASNEALAGQKSAYRARAMRDGLTGLWNRQAMEEKLAAACAGCLPGALFMIDLDGFKPVNDRYGHQVGDDALVAIARRIQSVVRPGDAVGRIGGDEFLVLAEDLAHGARAVQLAERIRNRIQAPMRVRLHGDSNSVEVLVGASVGYCLYAGTSVAPANIIRQADAAMYEDKTRRKGGSLGPG